MKSILVNAFCFLTLTVGVKFNSAMAQSDIVAIDILLEPDQTMLDSAKVYNSIMLKNYSGNGSYSLDELHTPHITVLQCFVQNADLDKVYTAVASIVKSSNPTNENLTSKGFYYFPYNDLGLAGITIDTTPGLMNFHHMIIEVLKPYIVVGTSDGFIQNTNGSAIAAGSSDYVNGFITEHSGKKYNPHVTIGLAHKGFLNELVAKPFNKFTFKCASVSIYHLGDFGTAQKKLWTSKK